MNDAAGADVHEIRELAREIRFLIRGELGERILEWARASLAPDPHGTGPAGDEYAVTSLYFETANFDVYHRRGSFGRGKYRIRRYQRDDVLFLERKLRTDRLLAKRRTRVGPDALDRLGHEAASPGWPGYWFHRRLVARGLKPLVQMSYDRVARAGAVSTGPVRLTLDRHLRVLPLPDRAFLPGLGHPLIAQEAILELKYRGALPAIFRRLVEQFALSSGSISKYRLGLRALDYGPKAAIPEGGHA